MPKEWKRSVVRKVSICRMFRGARTSTSEFDIACMRAGLLVFKSDGTTGNSRTLEAGWTRSRYGYGYGQRPQLDWFMILALDLGGDWR